MNNEIIQNHNLMYSEHDTKNKNIKIDELLSRIIDSKNEHSVSVICFGIIWAKKQKWHW